jgi:hypothetical protein
VLTAAGATSQLLAALSDAFTVSVIVTVSRPALLSVVANARVPASPARNV